LNPLDIQLKEIVENHSNHSSRSNPDFNISISVIHAQKAGQGVYFIAEKL